MSTEKESETATTNTGAQSTADAKSPCCGTNKLALVYGSWLLRIWLAVRAIQTGVEKFAGTAADKLVKVDGVPNEQGLVTDEKLYSLKSYHGVPEVLMGRFEKEPLMKPIDFLGMHIVPLKIYDVILGPVLLVLGVTILLGIAYRTSLFLLGLLYISLTWGLILIKQDDGVSWLGVHMILIALALMLADHNRWSVLKKW